MIYYRQGLRSRLRQRAMYGLAALAGLAIGCAAPPSKDAATETARVAFTDVTSEAGLGAFRHVTGAFGEKWFPETMGGGGGFIDYDGDGWLDVLLVGGATWPGHADATVPALWLYRNNSDGTFTPQTEAAGLHPVVAYGQGLAVADYDNDGDQDFVLTTVGENLLFRNEGGVFTEIGREAGLADVAEWSTSALFFDADRDGHLDLYIGNYVEWSPETDIRCTRVGNTKSYCTPELYQGLSGRFYRNTDGVFVEQTEAAGFGQVPGKTLAVADFDYNRDGWPDLVVANDTQRDLLFENQGDGTFVEKGVLSGIAYAENGRARAGMGIDTGVVDSTGEETVFVANFTSEMIGVYRHMGGGLFADRATVSKIGQPSLQTLTFGLFLFDADLDADLDLFAANGHIAEDIEQLEEGVRYRQRPQLFLNSGDGRFEQAVPEPGSVLAQPLVARGAAYADYDRDGDLDVLVTENGGPAHLWRNDLRADAHWLRVRLEGRQSNRDGLGARIVAVVGGRRMERRMRTGTSYLSQPEKVATFGLGAATVVDTLRVYWPSGQVDAFTALAADQEIHILEAAGAFDRVALNN